MEGNANKIVAMLGVALLLAGTPCLISCVLYPCSTGAAAPCHHKTAAKQPCSHQMLRAADPPAPAIVMLTALFVHPSAAAMEPRPASAIVSGAGPPPVAAAPSQSSILRI